MLSNGQIAARLSKLDQVETIVHKVPNKILGVETEAVLVRSARTGRTRRIGFSEIRDWKGRGPNSRIRRALARELGISGA